MSLLCSASVVDQLFVADDHIYVDDIDVLVAMHPIYGRVGQLNYFQRESDGMVEIGYLMVTKNFQRQGVASWLMHQLEQRFPDVVIDHMERTERGMDWARAYYGALTRYTLNGEPVDPWDLD